MSELRYDMAQYYSMKVMFEHVFGNRSYRRLKETATFQDWKKETVKLLQAIRLSIISTVEVADDDFFGQVDIEIEHGKKLISSTEQIDDLFAVLSATLTRIVFLQIGLIPNNYRCKTVTLRKNNWVLDTFRSVQYVQNHEQKEAVLRNISQKQKRKSLTAT